MNAVSKLKRKFALFCINIFFKGTHNYRIKRNLLNFGGISCERGVRVVGPVCIGTAAKLSVGRNTFIGADFRVYGNGSVSIGDQVDIAPSVTCLTGSHIISSDSLHRAGEGVAFHLEIENGCWIGARSTLMGNIIVKSGDVIGACSLVNKTTECNTVYVGVPAHKLKSIEDENDAKSQIG